MNFFEKTFNFKTYKTKYNDLVAQNKEVLKMYEDLQKSNNTLRLHYEDSSKYIDRLNKELSAKDDKIKSLHETRVTLNRTVNNLSEEKSVLEKELKGVLDSKSELLQRVEALFEDMIKDFAEDISSSSRHFDRINVGVNRLLGFFNGIDVISTHGSSIKNSVECSRDKIISLGIKLSHYKKYFESKMLYKHDKDQCVAVPDFFEKPENLDK